MISLAWQKKPCHHDSLGFNGEVTLGHRHVMCDIIHPHTYT